MGESTRARGRCDTVVGVDRLRALRHPRIREREREGDRASRGADVEHVVIELARIARGQLVARHVFQILREDQPELIVGQSVTPAVGDEGTLAGRFRYRDRLHAPLRRHLQPFLNDLFPSAEIELGDGFAIAGIKRSGPAAETFAHLSTGTQEQIAVLVRLAMGAMICERGEAVPIILDDALVFSDDDRIGQMFDDVKRRDG